MNHSKPKCLPALIYLLLLFNYSLAQQKISGIVVSEANLPLAGATASAKNSDISNITLNDGSFAIQGNMGNVLAFSFTGYKTHQVGIADETNIKVILQMVVISLDEVVVTGYTS